MKRQPPSIFNDILGPTMIGPSSSHTCGPARIGYLCQQLTTSNIISARIEFAKNGAYTKMYKGQRSDMGFISGLLGFSPDDPRLRDAYKYAKDRNLNVEFVISDFEPIVPNIAIITLVNEHNETIEVYSDSTGGGTVKLFKLNHFDISIGVPPGGWSSFNVRIEAKNPDKEGLERWGERTTRRSRSSSS
jgi:L-serine dehydratase